MIIIIIIIIIALHLILGLFFLNLLSLSRFWGDFFFVPNFPSRGSFLFECVILMEVGGGWW